MHGSKSEIKKVQDQLFLQFTLTAVQFEATALVVMRCCRSVSTKLIFLQNAESLAKAGQGRSTSEKKDDNRYRNHSEIIIRLTASQSDGQFSNLDSVSLLV